MLSISSDKLLWTLKMLQAAVWSMDILNLEKLYTFKEF